MKQTAVQWLVNEMRADDWCYLPASMKEDIINQAKEMDKEQKIEFANNYGFDICGYDYEKAEQYYNTTFKSE